MPQRPGFDESHPLWHELIARRRAGAKIQDLVRTAHERGYPSVSYSQVLRATQHVRYIEHLPDRTSFWLQKRLEDEGQALDALDTLRALASVSAEELWKYRDEMATADAWQRKAALAKLEGEERDRLTQLCVAIVNIEIKVGLRKMAAPTDQPNSRDVSADAIQASIGDLASDLVQSFLQGKVTVTRVSVEGSRELAPGTPGVPAAVDPVAELKLLGQVRVPGETLDGFEDDPDYEPPNFEETV